MELEDAARQRIDTRVSERSLSIVVYTHTSCGTMMDTLILTSTFGNANASSSLAPSHIPTLPPRTRTTMPLKLRSQLLSFLAQKSYL
jgi:hypothetical protein